MFGFKQFDAKLCLIITARLQDNQRYMVKSYKTKQIISQNVLKAGISDIQDNVELSHFFTNLKKIFRYTRQLQNIFIIIETLLLL